MTAAPDLDLRVRALTWEADGILGIEFVLAQGDGPLPAFTAGAHVDLHLPTDAGERVRSYSLLNDPAERHRYCVAVNRDAASSGGSAWIHTALRPGQVLRVSGPRNNFPLDDSSAPAVFIAGGIGITPMLSMIRRIVAQDRRPWTLHYAARSRAGMAFVPELQALARRDGGVLHLHRDDEAGRVLDVAGVIAALPPDAHVYACGPRPMLQAFEAATAGLPPGRVHLEYFGAKEAPATAGGFTVRLHRTKRDVAVAPGQTILDALMATGLEPLYSCQAGYCGTCEVAVLAGAPEHRDAVLSDAEKAANNRMMICCSGSQTPVIEIDL